MLEPSSSEEENDEIVRHEVDSIPPSSKLNRNSPGQSSLKHLHSSSLSSLAFRNVTSSSSSSSIVPSTYHQFLSIKTTSAEKASLEKARSSSFKKSLNASPAWSNIETVKETVNFNSTNSKVNEVEKVEKEEQERKTRLQLYVFVIRCISYPFNAKQPTDMVRRQPKVTKNQFETIVSRFVSFIKGELQMACDDSFINAINHYYQDFLKSEGAQILVNSGACSLNDFKDIFKRSTEKKIKSLPEIDSLSKETVLNSWMTKFEVLLGTEEDNKKSVKKGSLPVSISSTEPILTKEQLYDMFQHVLNIKKFEHQLLFNALQVRS